MSRNFRHPNPDMHYVSATLATGASVCFSQSRAMAIALLFLLSSTLCWASERRFDVKDDIYAFPQYDVSFSDSYILYDDAVAKLTGSETPQVQDDVSYEYEYLIGNGRPYLCAIPRVELVVNETEESTKLRTENDLVAAAGRGWQLLKDMEGQQCLYYTTGWWSYMFCYNTYVKQYHAAPVASQARQWPPAEDPNTPSYILGTYKAINGKKAALESPPQPRAGDLQTQSETTFLVQKLEGGTPCDLTGKPRKIEVQYHCSPGTPDRIGWIKETATCAYQMVIYTSRLCNDVIFQPPKGARMHKIECQRIATDEQAVDTLDASPDTPQIEETQKRIMVGKIELGGRRIVGHEAKKIERGRIVMTPEEQAEIVVVQEDGQIRSLSTAELKKLELDPEDVAAFQKEMQKLAGSSDWKIERLGDANGQLSLRGVVSSDVKKKGKGKQDTPTQNGEEEEKTGSEERYKDEL